MRISVRAAAAPSAGTCAAPVGSKGEPSAAESAATARGMGRPESTSVRSPSAFGSTLKQTSWNTASVPKEPGQRLHQVEAGDVLHDAAAGLHVLGEAVDELQADHRVAGGAEVDPRRARDIGRGDAADGRLAARSVEPAMVHRLEGQALALRRERLRHHPQRRSRLRRDDQFGRLVERDARELRGGDGGGRLHRSAEAGTRATAGDGERCAGAPRVRNDRGEFSGRGGGVEGHADSAPESRAASKAPPAPSPRWREGRGTTTLRTVVPVVPGAAVCRCRRDAMVSLSAQRGG